VRRLAQATAERGAQRVVWDLRHEAPPSDGGSAWRTPKGRLVLPGKYQVRLTVGDQVHTQPLDVRLDPAVTVAKRDRDAMETTVALQAQLLGATYHAGKAVDASVKQVADLVKALDERGGSAALRAQAAAASEDATRLRVALRGLPMGIAQQETYLPLADLTLCLYMTTEAWTGAPSPEQRQLTRLAHRDVQTLLAELGPFLSDTLPALRTSAQAAGVTWPADALPTALPDNLIPAYR
jgi:hypothetical protein